MQIVTMKKEKFDELMDELKRLQNENELLKKKNDEIQMALDAYDREHISW